MLSRACKRCSKPVGKKRTYCDDPECLKEARRLAGLAFGDKVRKDLPACKRCGATIAKRNRSYCDDPECRKASKGAHNIGKPYSGKTRGVPKSEETKARMREAFKKRSKNPAKGVPKSVEWRIKMAERVRAGIAGYTTSKRKPYVRKDGRKIVCRSSWEHSVCAYFDKLGIEWEYEPEVLRAGKYVYIPDFKLSDGRYIEVKGYFSATAKEKMRRICALYPVEIWDGPKLRRLGIIE